MKKSTIAEIIAFWFVMLFLYTALSKLLDFTIFRIQIGQSPFFKPIARWIAWFIPIAEFIVCALLFIPKTRLNGLYGALGLMIAFTLYVGGIMLLDAHLPCRCGGVIEKLSWKEHLVFNTVNVGVALTGLLLQRASRPAQMQVIAMK